VDIEGIVDALLRISQLVIDFPGVMELDVNPLMVHDEGQGVVGIDMRLVLS
jgi:acetyltransferase